MGGDDISKSVIEAKNKNSSTQKTTCRFFGLPRLTVEEAFDDYFGRRSAIVKALTTDVDEFLRQCDPDKDMVCLYGLPDGEWKVEAPVEFVPSFVPEPTVGINWGRTHMELHQWLFFVAFQTDAWLIFFALHSFANSRPDRERLFEMINELPTIVETIGGISKVETSSEEEEESFCGYCKRKYKDGEFWICCDYCETWYHGQCVGVSPNHAKHIHKFKCPIKCK